MKKLHPFGHLALNLVILLAMVSATVFVPALAEDAASFDRTIRDMPAVTVTNAGSTYVAWREYKDTNKVALVLQKISPAGLREWSIEKTVVPAITQISDYVTLTNDSEGNIYLAWAESIEPYSELNYRIQKYNSSGETLWQNPYTFFTTKNDEIALNLSDVSAPQLDGSGNIHLSYVERTDTTSKVVYQILNSRLGKAWENGFVVSESANIGEEEFFFTDVNIDKNNGDAYLAHMGLSSKKPTSILYSLVKLNMKGEKLWNKQYEIPTSDEVSPAIINGPTLDRFNNLYFGWLIADAKNKTQTQYYKMINGNGIIASENQLQTQRMSDENLEVTSLVSTENNIFFAESNGNLLRLVNYHFNSNITPQTISETIKNVFVENPARFTHVNNWSITTSDKDTLYLAWSQFTYDSQGNSGNYEVIVQKFNQTLSSFWAGGEKANSKRTAIEPIVTSPKPEDEPKKPRKPVIITMDSDNDGLSDDDETGIFRTNPYSADSDTDGYLDGAEVSNGYNPTGICRSKSFGDGPVHAYDKARVQSLDDELCRAEYLKLELSKLFGKERVKNISSHQMQLFINAFVYGDYPIAAIRQALKTGGHTLHPSIPWQEWEKTSEYQMYINK